MTMNGSAAQIQKFIKVADYAAANTTDVTGTGVDMAQDGGWDEVTFLVSYGTAAANNLIHAETSSDDGSSDAYTDLEDTEVDLEGSSDEDQVLTIVNPPERYVRCVAARGTSSTLENIWAVLSKPRSVPADNTTAGTLISKTVVGPAEGTK